MKGVLEVAAFAVSWTPEIVPSEDRTHSAIAYSDLSEAVRKIMLLPVMRTTLEMVWRSLVVNLSKKYFSEY